MTPPPSPPPLPGKSRVGLIVGVVIFIGALIVGAVVVSGVTLARRVQEKKAASRAALEQIEKTAQVEREKMVDLIESGEVKGGDEALGRLKEQFDKSAGAMSGADAVTMRAMSVALGKIQARVREYETATGRMMEAGVMNFHIGEKATIEQHRQLVREFLASNARFTEILAHGEEMVRAELVAAQVPPAAREATVRGFNESQSRVRGLQMRIRAADKTLGEALLGILDQLEKEWGRWSFDEAAGALRFQDDSTMAAHNAFIAQIQAAGSEQTQAQEELVARMRASQPR